jgi:hypothetical protein
MRASRNPILVFDSRRVTAANRVIAPSASAVTGTMRAHSDLETTQPPGAKMILPGETEADNAERNYVGT